MKRVISLALAIILCLSGVVFSHAEEASCSVYDAGNINKQNYETWAQPIGSYLVPVEDGNMIFSLQTDGTMKAFYYNADYSFRECVTIPAELSVFGGFFASEDNYFILTGTDNIEENSSKEVMRLTKYDKSWVRQDSLSIKDCNTTTPFRAGSVRFTSDGQYIFVRTCHEMYKSSDGYNHQANLTLQIDAKQMLLTDYQWDVSNELCGYVSHSFNQFIRTDSGKLVAVDHGDASPRSVVLIEYPSTVADKKISTDYYSSCAVYDMLKISGQAGDNYTGCSVGGFEISSTSYIVAGASVDQGTSEKQKTRNIFVSSLAKDHTSSTEAAVTYLTEYKEGLEGASTPHLVKTAEDSFIILWSHLGRVYYCELNSYGEKTGEILSFDGDLSDCAPVVSDGKLIWYTANNGEICFYEIDLSDITKHSVTKSRHGHHYELNSDGVYECVSCKETVGTQLPQYVYSMWESTQEEGYYSSATEEKYHPYTTVDFITGYENQDTAENELEVISSDEGKLKVYYDAASGRGYLTLCQPGSVKVTVREKYHKNVSSVYTFNISHDFSEYIADDNASCLQNATKTAVCSVCDEKDSAEIPGTKLSHDWQKTKNYMKTAASCDRGTVYYKECSLCGTSSENITDETWTDDESVLEHSMDEWEQTVAAECEQPGVERRNCKNCTYFETRSIPMINHKRAAYYPLQDSTCIGIGYTEGTYCPDCDTWISGHEIIAKKPHSFTEYISDDNATCTQNGTKTAVCDSCHVQTDVVTEEDSALGHDWNETKTFVKLSASCENDGEYFKECSRCGISSENETGESWKDEGSLREHELSGWYYSLEPTCELEGEEKRDCKNCAYSETKPVEALKHINSVLREEKASTCQSVGYTQGVFCPDCKQWISGHEVIEKKPHVFTQYISDKNATCTQDGTKTAVCDSCKKAKSTVTEAGSAKGHKYTNAIVVDPTCTKKGYTLISCECGKGTKTDYTNALGHRYTTYQSDGNATYLKDGTKTAICDRGCSSYVTVADKGSMLKVGTAKKVTVVSGATSIKLTWSEVTGATGYAVYVRDNGWKLLKKTTAKSYTVTGLNKVTKYDFAIRAYRVQGSKTIWAPSYKVVKTATKPATPAKLIASQTTNSITLTWSPVKGASGYRIYKYYNGWKHITLTKATSYKLTSLYSGTKYIYCVRPYIKTDDGYVWGDYIKITTATAPEAPTIRLASTAKGRATVAWNNVSGENGYQVYYSTDKATGFRKIANYKADSVKAYKTGLTSGKTYYFKVRAYRKVGDSYIYSPFSKTLSVKIK